VRELESVYLYDIDDLQQKLRGEYNGTRREIAACQGLITQHLQRFAAWLDGNHAALEEPTAVARPPLLCQRRPAPRVMKPLIIAHGEARSLSHKFKSSAIYCKRPARRFPSKRKIISTSGDNFTNLSLTAGSARIVTKEIEDQLLHAEIQVAVHSLKDLPTILPDGLMIGAISSARRCSRCVYLEELWITPGIAAWRLCGDRAAFVGERSCWRSDRSEIEEIRGNVETRLARLRRTARWTRSSRGGRSPPTWAWKRTANSSGRRSISIGCFPP